MSHWFEMMRNADRKTQSFILNAIVYGSILIISTIYCYARLDYVRSLPKKTVDEQKINR